VTGGDAIGDSPDPRTGISNRITASDDLRERLRDGIARDLGIATERDERAPELLGVLEVDALDPRPGPCPHDGVLHDV
jgi:hypothetical protein